MKCSNCGSKFEEGQFCPNCGTKYKDEQKNQVSNEITTSSQPKKTTNWIKIVLLFVVILIAWNIINGKPKQKEETKANTTFETIGNENVNLQDIPVVNISMDRLYEGIPERCIGTIGTGFDITKFDENCIIPEDEYAGDKFFKTNTKYMEKEGIYTTGVLEGLETEIRSIGESIIEDELREAEGILRYADVNYTSVYVSEPKEKEIQKDNMYVWFVYSYKTGVEVPNFENREFEYTTNYRVMRLSYNKENEKVECLKSPLSQEIGSEGRNSLSENDEHDFQTMREIVSSISNIIGRGERDNSESYYARFRTTGNDGVWAFFYNKEDGKVSYKHGACLYDNSSGLYNEISDIVEEKKELYEKDYEERLEKQAEEQKKLENEPDDYLFPSDQYDLRASDFEGKSAQYLCYAKNKIYARHQYSFESPELREYFSTKDWYYESVSPESFNDSMLTDVEYRNLERIIQREKEITNGKGYQLDREGYDIKDVYKE